MEKINQSNGTREWEGVTAVLCRVIGEDLSEEVTEGGDLKD